MVVEWMDVNKQHKKARAQPLAYSIPAIMQHRSMGTMQVLQPGVACMVPSHLANQLCMTTQLFC